MITRRGFPESALRVTGVSLRNVCPVGDDRKGLKGTHSRILGWVSRKRHLKFQVWLRLVFKVACNRLPKVFPQ